MITVRKIMDLEKEKEIVENPECQEKPMAYMPKRTSEDYHGGDESTQSLPSTPSPQKEGQEQKDQSENNGSDNKTSEKGNETSENSDSQPSEDTFENSEGSKGESETTDQKITENSETSQREGSENSEKTNEKTSEKNEGSENNETIEVVVERYPAPVSGEKNTNEVVDFTKPTQSDLRTAFYRLIEKIAEDDTKIEDVGFERYSAKLLLMRQYSGRTLSDCMVSRVKQAVVMILDTSGSMEWWTDTLTSLASIALCRKDIEVYIAPNGEIESRLYLKNGKFEAEPVQPPNFSQRSIIYVGDYDGADTPVELSWKNRVFWICPESRYRYMEHHDWVHYTEANYRGMWFRALNEIDLKRSFKLMQQPYRKLRYDFHSENKYDDDE